MAHAGLLNLQIQLGSLRKLSEKHSFDTPFGKICPLAKRVITLFHIVHKCFFSAFYSNEVSSVTAAKNP